MENVIFNMKLMLEKVITTASFQGRNYQNGQKAKEGLIRSQKLINLLHEGVKEALISKGIKKSNIYPPKGDSKPELELTGFFKKKNQDVCVIPKNISKIPRKIEWGPLSFENLMDNYGLEFTRNTLVINIRSQLSSIAKNSDTLFERTYAEADNLHRLYNDIVLGEVYLIPVFEYDEIKMLENKVGFKDKQTNLEKYISFFHNINGRVSTNGENYKYERCSLIIVDFSKENPKIYNSTSELKKDNLVSQTFNLELNKITFDRFVEELLEIYSERHKLENILEG